MPLVIIQKDERSCPTILCDFCYYPISDAKDGNYAWEHNADEPTIRFSHKGCHLRLEDAHGVLLTDELNALPIRLAANLNQSPEDAKQVREFLIATDLS